MVSYKWRTHSLNPAVAHLAKEIKKSIILKHLHLGCFNKLLKNNNGFYLPIIPIQQFLRDFYVLPGVKYFLIPTCLFLRAVWKILMSTAAYTKFSKVFILLPIKKCISKVENPNLNNNNNNLQSINFITQNNSPLRQS